MTSRSKSDNLGRYDTLFEDYLQNIALTSEQTSRIDEVMEDAAALFMSEYNDMEIYAQGSYAIGTLVRPLTEHQSKNGIAGEYDIDLALQREGWGGARDTLNEVRKTLQDTYQENIDPLTHNSCERVHHYEDSTTGVKFHADYVPILHEFGKQRHAANRRGNSWFLSDTRKLVDWFHSYRQDKPFLQALIVTLKRVRDYAGLADILPSIWIVSIACSDYKDSGSYFGDLIWATNKVTEIFSFPCNNIVISLPTTGENLAAKLTEVNRQKILEFFVALQNMLNNELINKESPDIKEIRKYLSDAFPCLVSEYPDFLESLRSQGFSIELDGSLKIYNLREIENKHYQPKNNSCQFKEKGKELKFVADEAYDGRLYDTRWQVLNAAGSPHRRGTLFKAKSKSGREGHSENIFVNWETESYDGMHWIRCYIFDRITKRVIAISRKFYVRVFPNT